MSRFELPNDVARLEGELLPPPPEMDRVLPAERSLVASLVLAPAGESSAELLARAAKDFLRAHQKSLGAAKSSVSHARDAGICGFRLKHLVGHGKWSQFVKEHFRGEPSLRTVQAYMQIAEGWEILEANAQRVALLTIRDALRLIAQNARENAVELTPAAPQDGPAPLLLEQLAHTVLGEVHLAPDTDTGGSLLPPKHSFSAADGLAQEWSGRVFLHPPKGRDLAKWIAKLRSEYPSSISEALVLLAARTNTPTFQELAEISACLAFLRRPVEGEPSAGPQLLAYLGDRVATFAEAFEEHAVLLFPRPQDFGA